MNQVPRGRGQLVLLAILFFGPLVAALLLYFVLPGLQPQSRTNYGELLSPAQPLPELQLVDAERRALGREALLGHWTYIYLGGERCDPACIDKLYQIRQIRALLNEKRSRVQRVYLAPQVEALPALREQLGALHPDLRLLAENDPGQPLRRQLAARRADAQALYLVDPLGNWLMVYPGRAESPGILKDIKKLLRISQIG